MQSKLSAEILYPSLFKAPWKANGSGWKLFKTNLLMPEDVAYISSKSGVNTSRDGKVMGMAKKVLTDRQTDGFSSLYSRCPYVGEAGRVVEGGIQLYKKISE